MTLAPIIVFAYNRPQLLSQTLESLQANHLASESDLFIFCDGPKSKASESDLKKNADVRKIVREKFSFKSVTIYESETNKGLGPSVIAGVTKIVNEFGKVIVLEDDLLTSTYFLEYMNTALDKYENEDKVMQISGYMFPVEFTNLKTDAIFLPYTTTWGWATWSRAWKYFDDMMSGYEKLKNDKLLRHKFDMEGTYPYFKLLEKQKRNKLRTWGITWYLSVFIKNGLTLHPVQSLVVQKGFGKEATNTFEDTSDITKKELRMLPINIFPETVEVEQKTFDDYINYFRSLKINSTMRILKLFFNPKKLINIIKKFIS